MSLRAAVLTFLAGACWPLFGSKPEPRALLWVPEQAAPEWDDLRALVARYPDARFTVALAPQDIPEEPRKWLAEESKRGRLEFALRIPGDPILPLIFDRRQRDVIDRVASGRAQHKGLFETYPAGIVPGDGALSQGLVPFLEKQGLRWAAIGEGGEGPWQSPGGLLVLPFRVPTSTRPAALLDEEGGALVLPDARVETLDKLFSEGGTERWTTVSSAAVQGGDAPPSWPTWTGTLSSWTALEGQKLAWDLYDRTSQALRAYQDSGSANLDTLNSAAQLLYAAQASRYFTPQGVRSPAVMKEFQNRLRGVYRRIRVSPPKALGSASASKTEPSRPGKAESPAADDESQAPAGIRSGLEDSALWLENPEGSSAGLPEQTFRLSAGAAAQDLWTPASLRVGWSDKTVDFVFKMKRLSNGAGAPSGFDSLLLDLYIDQNHLQGRGSTVLLPGRNGFVRPPDAWEYVLTVSGWGAGLYRPVPGSTPVLVAPLKASADLKKGEIAVSLPRAKLRGSPVLWGYLLLCSATDREHAMRVPPDGTSGVLGLLGPLDAQARLRKPGGGYKNFSAVRVED